MIKVDKQVDFEDMIAPIIPIVIQCGQQPKPLVLIKHVVLHYEEKKKIVPQPYPLKDTHAAPWKYNLQFISAKIAGNSAITRSGRAYGPSTVKKTPTQPTKKGKEKEKGTECEEK